MASDSDYMAFLNKANAQRDAGSNQAQTQSSSTSKQVIKTETVETGVKVPDVLKTVNTYYVSETDEPFEPVALKWEGAARGIWPGIEQFASLITSSEPETSRLVESDSIETFSPNTFDPKNQYSAVLRAVRSAAVASSSSSSSSGPTSAVNESGVDVRIYRVEVGKSRVEYWVLSLDVEDGKIVGLRAKAIET